MHTAYCIQLTEVGTRVHTIITSDPDIGDAASVEFTLVSTGDFVTVSKKILKGLM